MDALAALKLQKETGTMKKLLVAAALFTGCAAQGLRTERLFPVAEMQFEAEARIAAYENCANEAESDSEYAVCFSLLDSERSY